MAKKQSAPAGVPGIKAGPLRTDAVIAQEEYAPGRVRCKGPRVLDETETREVLFLRDKLLQEGDVAAALAFFEDLNAQMAPEGAEALVAGPKDDTFAEVQRALVRLTNARAGCGADVGPLMAEEDFDGRKHTLVCPVCGTTLTWWPPLSVEQSKTVAGKRKRRIAEAVARHR